MNLRNRVWAIAASAMVGLGLLVGAARVDAATETWIGDAGDGAFENASLESGNWGIQFVFNEETELFEPRADLPPGSLTATANNTANTNVAIFNFGANVKVTHYRKLGGFRLTADNNDTVTISGFASTLPTTNISFLINPGVLSGDQYTSSDLRNSLDVLGGHLVINGAFNDENEPLGGEIRFGQMSSAWNVVADSTVTTNLVVTLANTQTQIRKRGAGTVILNGNPTGGNGSSGGGNATSAADAFNWHIEEGTLVGASGAGTQWRANATGISISSGATVHLKNSTNWGPNAAQTAASNGFKYSEIAGTGVGGLGAIRVSDGDSLFQTGTNAAAGGNPSSFQLVTASTGIGVDTGASLTVTDDIGGTGGLTKLGGGLLVLMAKNHYTGDTTVEEGTLLINAQRDDVVKNISAVAAYAAATNTTQLTVDATAGLSVGQLADGIWTLGAFNASTNTFVQGDASSLAPGPIAFHGITHALASATVTVKDTATLGGTGKILGSHVIVEDGGYLAPGASIGTFDVGSATFNNDSTLKIEFGNNDIDKLVVNGTLDLAGAVFDFSSLGNLADGEYIFATYESLAGNSYTAPNLPESLTIHHNTTEKYFSLIGEFGEGLAGDHNKDGFVNAADYVLWRDNPNVFGGDPNGYNEWKANFGAGPEGSGAMAGQQAAVPEPGVWGLLLTALAAFTYKSRQRK